MTESTAENTPKTCKCYKSDYRDPKCEAEFPIICPWREWQLSRFVSGKFPGKSPGP
jgi:hypothetical protein